MNGEDSRAARTSSTRSLGSPRLLEPHRGGAIYRRYWRCMKKLPIVQGYKKPITLMGERCPCLTTELAHRTNSFGLPHVMEVYEDSHLSDRWKVAKANADMQGGVITALVSTYYKGAHTSHGDRPAVLEMYENSILSNALQERNNSP